MWKPSSNLKVACLVSLILCIPVSTLPQTGSSNEPVRYVGGVYVDLDRHDGRLRPAIGVENHQVMRANRTHPELGDGFGWTYNHASMLAYWNGRFYLEFLSNPVGEHRPPGHTVVVISTDGRLLVLGFYGHAPDPFNKGGIGRVVREVYKDGTYGPIYFIRYGSLTDWTESNTSYPWYTRSKDEGFVAACNALLANKLMISQWRDEDRGPEDFQPLKGPCSAVSFYHRKDGKAVGLCKEAYSVLSSDEGKTWTTPVISRTVITNNAKVWGQRTKDGRYALAYNPVHYGSHRWPLVIVTGEDGILFDDMLLVHGDVPPRRFIGNAKDFGPQYFRGIAEGNGSPPGNDMWLTYSVNKEDIWVSRIPVPVWYRVEGPVNDSFDNMQAGGKVLDWNIYNPKWASVGVVEFPSAANKSLELQDKDPYDYAKAVRVFAESPTVNLSCKEQGRFGGWPANNGIWSWGNEIVVGFMWGYFKNNEKGHAIDGAKPSVLRFARSLDGGETWKVEVPSFLDELDGEKEPVDCPGGIDFSNPNFAMRVRMNDKRGEPSRIYYSADRCKTWQGPYKLPMFGQKHIMAKTDYLVNGKHDLMAFITASKQSGGEGRVFCTRTTDGGKTWEFVSWIGPEPKGFSIMPSSVRLSATKILSTLRCKEGNVHWIEGWVTEDNGKSWQFLNRPAESTGGSQGNPSTLIKLKDGRLAIAYGYRSEPYGMMARLSGDQGRTWGKEIILRSDAGCWDLGYPRSVQRADGKIVTAYYYNDHKDSERYIAATIWDPGNGN